MRTKWKKREISRDRQVMTFGHPNWTTFIFESYTYMECDEGYTYLWRVSVGRVNVGIE